MKRVYLLAIFGFSSLFANDQNGEKTSPESYMELLHDQKLDESISSFLNFLDIQKKTESPAPESEKFHEAYKTYLNLQGKPSPVVATEIILTYGPTTEDPYLAYLLAASYANNGRFDQFYPLFIIGYRNDPTHYLADKMKAVLHIKLYERLLPGKQKELERDEILHQLQNALLKNSSDHMLYKMMIAFSSEASRPQQIDTSLNKMINDKVVYPRVDLLFYVRMALAVGNRTLAQRFIDYSRDLFGYSRSLEAAQRILDSKEL